MVKEKLSITNEKKKNSLLEKFSRRAESANSIRLRSFEKRTDENVRRSRSQGVSKKLAAMREQAEQEVLPQESVYEEIPFDLTDDDDSTENKTTPAPNTGRRFTVEKVNEYESLAFNDEDKDKQNSPPVSPSLRNISTPTFSPPVPKKLSADLPVNFSSSSFTTTSNLNQVPPKHPSVIDAFDVKRNNSGSTIKSTNKPMRTRSKSMGNALHNLKSSKTEETTTSMGIKRRTMLEVIRQIDHPVEMATMYMEEDVEKGIPRDMNRRASHHHGNDFTRRASHHVPNGDVLNKNAGVKFNSVVMVNAPELDKAHSQGHGEHSKKEPTKIAVGISIVYGMILACLGIFLSLDAMSGKLGSNRIIYTIFYSLLYIVSIVWIIYLFFDIKKYVKKLNWLLESENESEENKIVRGGNTNNPSLFKAVRSDNNEPVEIYESREKMLNNINANKHSASKSDRLKAKFMDFSSRSFKGYLVDKNQPYNMYLKVGIGAFCLVTLLQCTIEVSEGVENLVNGKFECSIETQEAILSFFQFLFSSMQFLFIFLRGNIVICINTVPSSILTMHLVITNLIVWVKFILLETLMGYYEHVLHENLLLISKNVSSSTSAPYPTTKTYPVTTEETGIESLLKMASDITSSLKAGGGDNKPSYESNYTDCHDPDTMVIKKFALDLKHYMYPATIEFSITCATIFMIMWAKIGQRQKKNFTLPPTQKKFEGVGMVNMPYSNLYIMLDCTKTSKGLFFGIIVFVVTLLSAILFIMFKGPQVNTAKILSEATEIALLVIALAITLYAFFQVRQHYDKVVPEANMFDVVLEIFSLFGIYAYSVNSLIALIYSFANSEQKSEELKYYYEYITNLGMKDVSRSVDSFPRVGAGYGEPEDDLASEILAAVASILSIIQGTFQTLFILECLRRYAASNSPFMRKPARELITALLLTNVSMWFFDTLSAKRFETKPYLIEHFGILKWSIINAFSSPIAIFYRFHSSVCLSDIWYGLYYGEYEEPEPNELDFDSESDIESRDSQDSRF